MAKYLTFPKSLKEADRTFIKDAIDATEEVFKGDLFGENNRPLSEPYTSADGKYHWPTNKALLIHVTNLTGTNDIRTANSVLYKALSTTPEGVVYKGAEKSVVDSNVPQKGTREVQEAERKLREEVIAKADIKGKELTEELIKQKQAAVKLRQELKGKKIYYKVEDKTSKSQEVQNLETQAKTNPKQFIKDTAQEIAKNPNLKNLSPEELRIASEQAAITTYETFTGSSPIIQSAILEKAASSPNIKFSNARDQQMFGGFVSELTNQKMAQFELASQLFRLPTEDEINITFSATPQPGYREFDLDQTFSTHIQNLNRENALLDSLTNVGENEIKSQLLQAVGGQLDTYIASLPANSLLAQTYNSEIVQLGLTSLGLVEAAPWVAVEGSWIGNMVVSSGYAPIAGFIQAKTGIDLGIKLAEKVGEKVIEKSVQVGAEVGTEVAGGTGIFAGLTAALTPVLGPLAPAASAIISWIGGNLIIKGIKKIGSIIPWKTVKEWSGAVIGVVSGLISLPFVGLGAAIGIGAAATVTSTAFGAGLGGITLAGVASGAASVIGAIATATIGAIATPIIAILIGFPVVVALILFIINSGAYVVPPGSLSMSTLTGPRDCAKGEKIVQRAKAINDKLQLGFNHYYNKSPDYPNLWNETLFKQDPNPPVQTAVIGAEDMFWCNYTPTESYLAINEVLPFPLSYMMKYFQNNQKWVSGDTATPDEICPGDTIFFKSPADATLLSHVAVVGSVSADEITTIQSNSPWKTMNYMTDSSGHFPIYGSGNATIKIIGFGAP